MPLNLRATPQGTAWQLAALLVRATSHPCGCAGHQPVAIPHNVQEAPRAAPVFAAKNSTLDEDV